MYYTICLLYIHKFSRTCEISVFVCMCFVFIYYGIHGECGFSLDLDELSIRKNAFNFDVAKCSNIHTYIQRYTVYVCIRTYISYIIHMYRYIIYIDTILAFLA